MFNGRNQFLAKVHEINENMPTYQVSIEVDEDKLVSLTLGSLVTVDGCALTICAIDALTITVELTKEDLRTSTLGNLKKGNIVCLERPLKLGDDIGLFMLSGQINTRAEISRIFTSEHNHQIWFKIERTDLARYLFEKTLIGINGLILSVAEVVNNRFCIHLSTTQKLNTALGQKKLGQKVNIEFNHTTIITVDTILRQFEAMKPEIHTKIQSITTSHLDDNQDVSPMDENLLTKP